MAEDNRDKGMSAKEFAARRLRWFLGKKQKEECDAEAQNGVQGPPTALDQYIGAQKERIFGNDCD